MRIERSQRWELRSAKVIRESQQLKHKSTQGSGEARSCSENFPRRKKLDRKFTEEAEDRRFTEEVASALSRPLPTPDWRQAPKVKKVKK